MKKRRSRGLLLLLAIFAAALAFGVTQVNQVGSHLQYVIAAPSPSAATGEEQTKVKPNQPVKTLCDSWTDAADELNSSIAQWTLGGIVEQASYQSDNGGSGLGRLTLLGENAFAVNPMYLRYGRLIDPEELKRGDKVILLDEQLALTLFNISDPLERTVLLGDASYRVVGILRHTKQVGDFTDAGACVPLASIFDVDLTLDALMVEAVPISGTGASVAFKTAAAGWQANGTMIDLGKESMAAKLWLRVLLFLCAITLTLRGVRTLNHYAAAYIRRYQEKLKRRYAVQLMPELIGIVLLFVLGYGAAAIAAAVAVNYIVTPVYTFPEWIPAVLVEWKDITAAFWKVWQSSATLREWRTPELLRLRYDTLLIQGCSAACGVIAAMLYARIRGKDERTAESLEALYREGVIVSTLRTTHPLTFEALGYLPCEDSEEIMPTNNPKKKKHGKTTQAMLRIVNARSILEQLPNSPKEGSFVIELTDEEIASNNVRLLIDCTAQGKHIEIAERTWDLQMSVQALTQLVYGRKSFHDFLETTAGYDMKMRNPAMDGLFDHHLHLTKNAG